MEKRMVETNNGEENGGEENGGDKCMILF